jgi:indole-3-glycerol phosphate synthase
MGFLTDLVDDLRRRLDRDPLDDAALMARAQARPPARGFETALRARTPAIIAEVKRASPSAGAIAVDADPIEQAVAYRDGGAAVISVLTETTHFGGSLLDLEAVHAAVDVPVLRKDFLVVPSQLIEARAHGADAVLLIMSCLRDDEVASMISMARDLGLGVLLETHSDEDLDRALDTDATVVGVNARDLETLVVDTDAARGRLGRIPAGRIAVMESGVGSRRDVEAAVAAGASAILVGEALMRSGDPSAAVRALMGEESMR